MSLSTCLKPEGNADGPCSQTNTVNIVSALSVPVQCFITLGFWCNHWPTQLCGAWDQVCPEKFVESSWYVWFCHRYKSLCPDTWPSWDGRLVDGVSTLVRHLGYKPEEYKLGRFVVPKKALFQMCPHVFFTNLIENVIITLCTFRTKIFIRFPKTLFATEDALEVRKHSLGRNLFFLFKIILVNQYIEYKQTMVKPHNKTMYVIEHINIIYKTVYDINVHMHDAKACSWLISLHLQQPSFRRTGRDAVRNPNTVK